MEIGAGDEAKRTFVTKEASFSLRGFGLRPHPSGTFNSYLGYGGYWNNGGWGTSEAQVEIDRLVRKAAQTFNPDDQNYLYQQASAAVHGERPGRSPHRRQPVLPLHAVVRNVGGIPRPQVGEVPVRRLAEDSRRVAGGKLAANRGAPAVPPALERRDAALSAAPLATSRQQNKRSAGVPPAMGRRGGALPNR